MDSAAASALSLRQAVALGLMHGPTELLPISSSAHTTLAPWLLGWRYDELDPAVRKSFEVALHAGTALGLLTRPPYTVDSPSPSLTTLICAIGPPAAAGFVLGKTIERRLGTPRTIAAGLLAGSLAMSAAELHGGSRRSHEARPADGLALGLAQALALMPGLSRSGATTAAARLRGFAALDADRLSWQVGLPVIAGAALLQGARQARTGIVADQRCALAAGSAAALLSTHLSVRLLTPGRRLGLLPATVGYRMAIASLVTRTMRARAAGTPGKSK
ncbi:MAG TPA: undecaprenyl-diphosphate phosphatase [Solirubrobacteraceae bacterium]|nr:undecaprenyl-diphosphate phosphatase [Solirubrobacteraceae bacterium]